MVHYIFSAENVRHRVGEELGEDVAAHVFWRTSDKFGDAS